MKSAQCVFILVLLGSACGDGANPGINDNSSGNPVTAPVDYLGTVNKGRKKAIGEVGLMQVNSALNQFQASNFRPAKSLQELMAEGYLTVLPELSAGMKWHYNPQTGKASIVPAQ
jgi:hypothetical protein